MYISGILCFYNARGAFPSSAARRALVLVHARELAEHPHRRQRLHRLRLFQLGGELTHRRLRSHDAGGGMLPTRSD